MLKHARFWVTLLLFGGLLMVASESAVEAQKKKPPPPRPVPTPTPPKEKPDPDETKNKPAIESEQLNPGNYRGKLVSTPNEGGLFRVAVEYQRVRVKLGKEAEFSRLQRDIVKEAAKATGNQTTAAARAQMTFNGRFYGGVYGSDGYFDRLAISGSLGRAAGAATTVAGENALLNGLLETVSDTQLVIFHAAPKVQVRVLKATEKSLDSIPSSQSNVDEAKKKQDKNPLPGYEGALTDLKVGQRILTKLAPTNPGSIYKRLVSRLIVEEEANPSSSSK